MRCNDCDLMLASSHTQIAIHSTHTTHMVGTRIFVFPFWLGYLWWLFHPWLTEFFFPHGFMCFRIFHLRCTAHSTARGSLGSNRRIKIGFYRTEFGSSAPMKSVHPFRHCYIVYMCVQRETDNVIAHNFVISNYLIIYYHYIATLHFLFAVREK